MLNFDRNSVIAGEHISLRLLNSEDSDELFEQINHPELGRFSNIPYPYAIERVHSLILGSYEDLRQNKALKLGIFDCRSKNFLGRICLVDIDWQKRTAEVTYWLGLAHWGKGYAKEALMTLMNFAFDNLSLNTVFASVREGNVASMSLLKKVGFELSNEPNKNKKEDQHVRFFYELTKKNFKYQNK